MAGNDEVIELSIQETQALRAKLGLPPLRGVSSSAAPPSSAANTVNNGGTNDGNNEELSLSIEETNALRLKIGLPPLRSSSNDGDDTRKKGSSTSTAIHAPPTNTAAESEARKRIEDAAAKRDALDRLKKLERENELANEGGDESALDFAAKMRQSRTAKKEGEENDAKETKKKKKKGSSKKTLAKNPRLALPADEEEEGEMAGSYTAADLQGIKISHAATDFEVGTTTVLTLADTSILDVDPDSKKVMGLGGNKGDGEDVELINVNMESDTKALENLRKKRQIEMGAGRAGGYAGYDDDEFEELGGIGTNTLGNSGGTGGGGSAENGGRKSKGFAIGGNGAASVNEDEKKNVDLFAGGAVTLESRYGNKVASDFMSYDKEELESREEKLEKERMKQMKILEKLRKKDKKAKKKSKKKHNKRSYLDDEEDDDNDENNAQEGENPVSGESLLESLEATAVQDKVTTDKRKRRRHGDEDAMHGDKQEASGNGENNENDTSDAMLMKEKRAKFEQIMAKGKIRTDKAFQKSSTPMATSSKGGEEAADDDDDAFLNAALAKARRLKRLKELNGAKSGTETGDVLVKGENAIVQAVELLKEAEAAKAKDTVDENGGKSGLTFEFDEMQEFTRALRAREDQAKRAPERTRGTKATVPGAAETAAKKVNKESSNVEEEDEVMVEDVDMEELAHEVSEDVNDGGDEEGAFGSTAGSAPIGRGMSSFLSLLKSTGEIKHSGREEMRGRAKDKRTYEDYEQLDLNKVVKINTRSAHEKDVEFANREIKLEYRDDFGRLLTRKEAYRNMCYDFHGHGSSKKNQERRIKQVAREQEEGKLASRQVMAEGGVGTFGALKATQKATGKAFIIHKT